MKKAGNVAWTWCTSLPLALGKTCMRFAITDSRSKGGVCLLCRWSSPPASFITGWFDGFLITCSNMEQIWKRFLVKRSIERRLASSSVWTEFAVGTCERALQWKNVAGTACRTDIRQWRTSVLALMSNLAAIAVGILVQWFCYSE